MRKFPKRLRRNGIFSCPVFSLGESNNGLAQLFLRDSMPLREYDGNGARFHDPLVRGDAGVENSSHVQKMAFVENKANVLFFRYRETSQERENEK